MYLLLFETYLIDQYLNPYVEYINLVIEVYNTISRKIEQKNLFNVFSLILFMFQKVLRKVKGKKKVKKKRKKKNHFEYNKN